MKNDIFANVDVDGIIKKSIKSQLGDIQGIKSSARGDVKKSETVDICGAISRMGGYVEDFIKYNPNMES